MPRTSNSLNPVMNGPIPVNAPNIVQERFSKEKKITKTRIFVNKRESFENPDKVGL